MSDVKSQNAANAAASSKPALEAEKREETVGRMNVLSVLIEAVKSLGEKATIEKTVEAAQKIKKQKKGKYESVVRNELVVSKEGIVRPRLSENGWKKAINFANAHEGHHPAIDLFGEEAAGKAAKELKLEYKPAKKG
jgi:hypothetical protein